MLYEVSVKWHSRIYPPLALQAMCLSWVQQHEFNEYKRKGAFSPFSPQCRRQVLDVCRIVDCSQGIPSFCGVLVPLASSVYRRYKYGHTPVVCQVICHAKYLPGKGEQMHFRAVNPTLVETREDDLGKDISVLYVQSTRFICLHLRITINPPPRRRPRCLPPSPRLARGRRFPRRSGGKSCAASASLYSFWLPVICNVNLSEPA